MSSIFISYSRADIQFVRRIALDLGQVGHVAQFDKTALKAGDHFIHETPRLITDADFVLVVLSTASCVSAWVSFECGLAWAAEISSGIQRLVTIRIDEAAPPGFLSGRNILDFDEAPGSREECLERLMEAFNTTKPLPKVSPTAGESLSSGRELVIFQSPEQELGLRITSRGLECHLTDRRLNRGGLQWILPYAKASRAARQGRITAYDPDPDKDVGLLNIGPHKGWLYSKRRFAGPADIVGHVRDLIIEARPPGAT